MLRHMLDTNLCIRVLRDRPPELRERFNLEAATLCISTVTLAELVHGARRSAAPAKAGQALDAFVARMETLSFDASAATHAGEIYADLARAGQVIGPFDILIAGHARSRGLVVVTGNLREFRRVDGLRSEDWLMG